MNETIINIFTFSEFRDEFFRKINEKTGWGKEQIKQLFDDTFFRIAKIEIKR